MVSMTSLLGSVMKSQCFLNNSKCFNNYALKRKYRRILGYIKWWFTLEISQHGAIDELPVA